MNPTAISFVISFLIAAFLSGENRRSRCFTGENRWLPSEDIFVVPKKVGEREFLFCREVGVDGCCLGGITSAQVDLLDVGFFWWCEDAGLFSRYL